MPSAALAYNQLVHTCINSCCTSVFCATFTIPPMPLLPFTGPWCITEARTYLLKVQLSRSEESCLPLSAGPLGPSPSQNSDATQAQSPPASRGTSLRGLSHADPSVQLSQHRKKLALERNLAVIHPGPLLTS